MRNLQEIRRLSGGGRFIQVHRLDSFLNALRLLYDLLHSSLLLLLQQEAFLQLGLNFF
jgi:hypothetical protein